MVLPICSSVNWWDCGTRVIVAVGSKSRAVSKSRLGRLTKIRTVRGGAVVAVAVLDSTLSAQELWIQMLFIETISLKGTMRSNSGTSSGSCCDNNDGIEDSRFSYNFKTSRPEFGRDSLRHWTDAKSMEGRREAPREELVSSGAAACSWSWLWPSHDIVNHMLWLQGDPGRVVTVPGTSHPRSSVHSSPLWGLAPAAAKVFLWLSSSSWNLSYLTLRETSGWDKCCRW